MSNYDKKTIYGVDFVNCTPHAITIATGTDGNVEFAAPQNRDKCPRVESKRVSAWHPVLKLETYGEVVNLPYPEPDTYLIVSRLVAAALPNRIDLVVPNTADAIRDENGHIVAVEGLILANPE